MSVPNFDEKASLFGIFDGHGGGLVSKFSAANFEKVFRSYYNNESTQTTENSLIQTFLHLDEMLVSNEIDDFLHTKSKGSHPVESFSTSINDYENIKANLSLLPENNIYNKLADSSYDNRSSFIEKSTHFHSKNLHISNNDGNKSSESIKSQSSITSNKATITYRHKNFIANTMGTTANVVFIEGSHFYVANVGDSYSVMYKNKEAIKLNKEHKTTDPTENERVYMSGCRIINDRVEGKLNLTRALGKTIFIFR